MRRRHYLIVVSRNACCNECGTALREGGDAVFRHTPKEIFCLNCSGQLGLKPRPSVIWEKRQRKRHKNPIGPLIDPELRDPELPQERPNAHD